MHLPPAHLAGVAVLGVLVLAALELATVNIVPAPHRPLISGVLLGAGPAPSWSRPPYCTVTGRLFDKHCSN
ncbi:hypothetical protein ACIQ9Q_40810 [Streptomyces sp. NPDC094438]|uniref:hypothetical protein n=1 Tax=Streptomyces sp. NPDC094438 TaxID=3366061 RepID=UPI0038165623